MLGPTLLWGSTHRGVSTKGLAALFQPGQALVGLQGDKGTRGVM